MKTIKHYGLVALACLTLVAGFVSCRQDDSILEPAPHNQPNPKAKRKKANGQVVSLNLEGQTVLPTLSKPRAMEYTLEYEGDEFPKLDLPTIDQKIKVLTIFHKLGDEASTTYAYLDWTIQEDRGVKKLKYVGEIQLNEGEFLKDGGDEWYMMGIIGGSIEEPKDPEEEPSTDEATEISPNDGSSTEGEKEPFLPEKLYFVNNQVYQAYEEGKKKKLKIDVPYILPWTKVNITADKKASNNNLKFKPFGSIIRLRVKNNMVHDYILKGFRIASNCCSNRFAFDLQKIDEEQIQLGDKSDTPLSWQDIKEYLTYDKENFGKWTPSYTQRDHEEYFHTTGSRGIWSAKAWPFETDGNIARNGGEVTKYYMSYDFNGAIEEIRSKQISSSYFIWMMRQTDLNLAHLKFNEGIKKTTTEIYLHVKPKDIKAEFEIPALPAMSLEDNFEHGGYKRIIAKIDGDLIINKVSVNLSEPPSDGSVDEKKNFVKNFSFVELYNPTLSAINLKWYSLIKAVQRAGDAKFMKRRTSYPETSYPEPSYPVDYITDATSLPLGIFKFTHKLSSLNSQDQWEYEPLVKDENTNGGEHSIVEKPRYKLLAGVQNPEGAWSVLSDKTIIFLASGFLLDDEYLTEEDKKMRDAILEVIKKNVDDQKCLYAIAYSDGTFDPSKGYFKQALSINTRHYYGDREYTYNDNSATLDIVPMMGFAITKKDSVTNKISIRDISIPYKLGYTETSKHQDDSETFYNHFDQLDYTELRRPLKKSMGISRIMYNEHPRMYPVYLPYDDGEGKYSTSTFADLWSSYIIY